MNNPYKVDPKKFKCDPVSWEILATRYHYIDNVINNHKYVIDSWMYLDCYIKNQRVFVLGCGPSIDRTLPTFISKYTPERGVVIACDSIMERLLELKFKPTYFITSEHDSEPCEGATHTSEVLISDKALEFFDDVPLIASIGANKKYVDRYPCNTKYMIVDDCAILGSWHKYKDRYIPKCIPWVHNPGNNVGMLAIGVAAHFNAKEVILQGMDMCCYPDGHHMIGHSDSDSPMALQEAGFQRAMEFFVSVNDGEFGVKTINCSGSGVLHPDYGVRCSIGKIEDYA